MKSDNFVIQKRKHLDPYPHVLFPLLLLTLLLLTACSSSEQIAADVAPMQPPENANAPMSRQSDPDTASPGIITMPTMAPAQAPTQTPAQAPDPLPENRDAQPDTQADLITEAYPAPTSAPTSAPTGVLAGRGIGGDILFLRGRVLIAYDVETGEERRIASEVREFTATPDGTLLALSRIAEVNADEVWLVNRDGSDLRQVTSNTRFESSLSWSPGGTTLVYASAEMPRPHPPHWISWSEWCATAEVHTLDIASGRETQMEPGCDPAFSNDGMRIAFATPPDEATLAEQGIDTPTSSNSIRLVNREGENGWDFARAGQPNQEGLLVYAPAWSPNSKQLAYQRFVGYQALSDINYTEMGGSFQGDGELLTLGAGWLLQPRFAPGGSYMAVVHYGHGNAAGWSGYKIWAVEILQPGEPGEAIAPSGTIETNAETQDMLYMATAVAWAPDGSGLAVALPPGWQNSANPGAQQESTAPGELWYWVPAATPAQEPGRSGNEPEVRLIERVDFASPVLWLPPR